MLKCFLTFRFAELCILLLQETQESSCFYFSRNAYEHHHMYCLYSFFLSLWSLWTVKLIFFSTFVAFVGQCMCKNQRILQFMFKFENKNELLTNDREYCKVMDDTANY